MHSHWRRPPGTVSTFSGSACIIASHCILHHSPHIHTRSTAYPSFIRRRDHKHRPSTAISTTTLLAGIPSLVLHRRPAAARACSSPCCVWRLLACASLHTTACTDTHFGTLQQSSAAHPHQTSLHPQLPLLLLPLPAAPCSECCSTHP